MPQIASDSFTTAEDSVALGTYSGSWTTTSGSFVVRNAGGAGEVRPSGGADNIAFWNANTFEADQYAQCQFGDDWVWGGAYPQGLSLRNQGSGITCYVYMGRPDGYYLQRFDAGTPTVLLSGGDVGWTTVGNQIMRFEAETIGAAVQLRVKRAEAATPTSFTTIHTVDDDSGSRILTAGKPGIFGYSSSTTVGGIDTWSGGNLAAAPAATILRQMMAHHGG